MSTVYVIDPNPTDEELAKATGWRKHADHQDKTEEAWHDDTNTVWVNRHKPNEETRCFERYGGNDPDDFVEALIENGYTVVSEHDYDHPDYDKHFGCEDVDEDDLAEMAPIPANEV